jgi:hypothetical protein
MAERINSYRDLRVYQRAMDAADGDISVDEEVSVGREIFHGRSDACTENKKISVSPRLRFSDSVFFSSPIF